MEENTKCIKNSPLDQLGINTSSLDSLVSGGTDGKVLCSSRNAVLRVCTRLLSRAAFAAAGRPLPPSPPLWSALARWRSRRGPSGLGLEHGLDAGLSSAAAPEQPPLSIRSVGLPAIGLLPQSVQRGPLSAARSQALINDRVRAVTQKAVAEEQPSAKLPLTRGHFLSCVSNPSMKLPLPSWASDCSSFSDRSNTWPVV
ncbi:hypothetical protein EYF80_000790 [Liparis tanakae]|uniref:Uncharacterized protein n=1 Tax=Liparis tanakae TaxID=230148 RepID=A0A4Z2JI21_9TELE|nr:hypothetical protein EYF80_000790 [Liparis tanakae]